MKFKTLKEMAEQKYYEVDIIQGDISKPGPHTKKRYVSACSKEELKQEAIKLVKYLLKLTKTKIIKMPKITLGKKIIVEQGNFNGKCLVNNQPTPEFFSALILCKLYDLTVKDLK